MYVRDQVGVHHVLQADGTGSPGSRCWCRMLLEQRIKNTKNTVFFTSVIVPVSVRVPVLVLELTVVLGHKSDLDMFRCDENSSL